MAIEGARAMKEFVEWVMLVCFLVGTPMFLIGAFIEKIQRVFEEGDSQSKLVNRLTWSGAALFALGLFLLLVVYPKL